MTMNKALYLVLPAILMVTVVSGMIFASSKPAIVEVTEELPIRASLERPATQNMRVTYGADGDLSDSVTGLYRESDLGYVRQPDNDVVDTVSKFEKFSVFLQAIQAVGLTEQLRSAQSVTIFAPTNRAFVELPEAVIEDLFKPDNRVLLRKFISAHIVSQKVVWSDLFGRKTRLRTISGAYLVVDGAGGVSVNGIRLRLSDLLATNGVIHVVDELVGSTEENTPAM
jgi:uncharacterized surface protein with fasciclin (FAS1) repeats